MFQPKPLSLFFFLNNDFIFLAVCALQSQNFWNCFLVPAAWVTWSALKHTVLLEGRHCDSVALLDIPEAGGQVYGHSLVVFLQAVLLSYGVEDISVDDSGFLYLHLDHTRQNLPSDRDITSERAFLVSVGLSVTSLGILKPISKFLWYCKSFCLPVLQASSSSYFERQLAALGRHLQYQCPPSSQPPGKRKPKSLIKRFLRCHGRLMEDCT